MKFADKTFQASSAKWAGICLGEEKVQDLNERAERFLEEALELGQAMGQTRKAAHCMVDYVHDRAKGEPAQEVGGVLTTLAVLCHALGIDMSAAGEVELERIFQPEVMEKIRKKTAAKPRFADTAFDPSSMKGARELPVQQGSDPAQAASTHCGVVVDSFAQEILHGTKLPGALKVDVAESDAGLEVDLGPFDAQRPYGGHIIDKTALERFGHRLDRMGGIPVEIASPKSHPGESPDSIIGRTASIAMENVVAHITSVGVREVSPGGEKRIYGVVKPMGPKAEVFKRLVGEGKTPVFSMRGFSEIRNVQGEVKRRVREIVTFDLDLLRTAGEES